MRMASTRPLRLGFIGGGRSSAIGQTHFAASRMDGRWELAAGAFSSKPETNRQTALDWHVPAARTYDDWRALIASERELLDAVAVLTPTPDHLPVVCALLDAGLPIICEKALVSSPREAEVVRAHADRRQSFLAVTFNYSGYPMLRELRERVRRGDLGRIQQIHLEMPQEGFARPPAIAGKAAAPQPWRLVDREIPTICLDLGVHLHHLAAFVTGLRPLRVRGRFDNYSRYPGLIDTAQVWLDYEGGASGSFWFTKTAIGNRNGLRLRLYGETGGAEWLQVEPESLLLCERDGSRRILDRGGATEVCGAHRYNRMKAGHPSGFVEAFANLYADIADALVEHAAGGSSEHPYVFGLDHAAEGLRLFEAAYRSHQDGRVHEVTPVCGPPSSDAGRQAVEQLPEQRARLRQACR